MATCLRADLFPESFGGLLAQTYAPLEILVLVDGADPGSIATIEAAGDPRVRYLTTPKPSGMVGAWNRIVSEARGKYFLFCADDDVLQPDALARSVDLLEQHPGVGFCHADFRFIDDDGTVIGAWSSHEGTWVKPGLAEWEKYIVRTGACMQTVVMRTDLWRQVGGWDEAGNPSDNSLYLKVLRRADVGHVAHVACHYRIRTRRTDSWEKVLRNRQEFYALSDRHMRNPPPGRADRVRSLRRALSRKLCLDTAVLLKWEATADHRETYLRWARETIWRDNMVGRCFAAASALGAFWLPPLAAGCLAGARGIARDLLVRSRTLFRRIAPQS